MEKDQRFQARIRDSQGNPHDVYFDQKIFAFTIFFSGHINQAFEIQKFKNPQHLQLIKTFFEAHNYNQQSIKVKKPLVSENFIDNVDQVTYNLLAKYQKEQNEQQAINIIQLADYLGLTAFKTCMYAAIGSKFYIGDSQADLQNFKKKNNLHDLTIDQEQQIIKQYSVIFDKLRDKFLIELQNEYDKIPN